MHVISPLAVLILTQAELKVLTDPFCFIDPLPALTTFITRLSLIQFLYGIHYQSHLCLIVTCHTCMDVISSAIFAIWHKLS